MVTSFWDAIRYLRENHPKEYEEIMTPYFSATGLLAKINDIENRIASDKCLLKDIMNKIATNPQPITKSEDESIGKEKRYET